MDYVLLIAGFVLLIKGADWLVKSASKLARSFGISTLVIGLTVVAFGTSAPELAIGIISGVQQANQVTFGDVVGSSIANIALIIGISAFIHPLHVGRMVTKKEIPISFGVQMLLLILALLGRMLSLMDGIILLAVFTAYLAYLFISELRKRKEAVCTELREEACGRKERWKQALILIAGLAGLFLGGKLVVDSSVNIARGFGMSEAMIGVTVVAFGTSLPELITCIMAAVKKEHDIAIGNIVGSNIFNVLFILGVSTTIHAIPTPEGVNTDIYVMLGVTALLFALAAIFKKINRYSGALFVLIYAAFITYKIVTL